MERNSAATSPLAALTLLCFSTLTLHTLSALSVLVRLHATQPLQLAVALQLQPLQSTSPHAVVDSGAFTRMSAVGENFGTTCRPFTTPPSPAAWGP